MNARKVRRGVKDEPAASNFAVDRTAGSRSLAAAGHRGVRETGVQP